MSHACTGRGEQLAAFSGEPGLAEAWLQQIPAWPCVCSRLASSWSLHTLVWLPWVCLPHMQIAVGQPWQQVCHNGDACMRSKPCHPLNT